MNETNNKGNDLFAGRTIFSGAEAAQYARTSWGTFKNHVFVQDRIPNSKVIGNRRCFTRAQLDQYREQKETSLEFDVSFYTVDEAADYCGLSRDVFLRYLYKTEYGEMLEYERIGGSGASNRGGAKKGGVIIFTKEVLDNFKLSALGVAYVN